jgi:predicted esterase
MCFLLKSNNDFGQLSYNDLYGGDHDERGIRNSIEYVKQLILREIDHGISSHNIVLGGFSQGGAIALLAGLSINMQLGGIFGLSTYLPMLPEVESLIEPSAVPRQERSETPVWMGHGMNDALVKYLWGKWSSEKIREMGWNVGFNGYE